MIIVQVICPLLLLSLFGFFLIKRAWVSQVHARYLSYAVFNLGLPALLFVSAAKAQFPQPVPWVFLGCYYGVVLALFLLTIKIARRYWGFSQGALGAFAMTGVYSNITIIGIPICAYGLGEAALVPLLMLISIHNLVLFTLGLLAVQWQHLSFRRFGQSVWYIIKQLLQTPITASLLLGLLCNLFGVELFPTLLQGLGWLGELAIPLALVVLGMSLSQYQIQAKLAPALYLVILKMGIFPLLVALLVFICFELDPLWSTTAVMAASLPVGISCYGFAQRYMNEPKGEHVAALVASSIVISTLLSVVSLSGFLVMAGLN